MNELIFTITNEDQQNAQMIYIFFSICSTYIFRWGYAVEQLVEALRYKPEGRGFDYRWSHWNFSVT
jgi:hypothetical protein